MYNVLKNESLDISSSISLYCIRSEYCFGEGEDTHCRVKCGRQHSECTMERNVPMRDEQPLDLNVTIQTVPLPLVQNQEIDSGMHLLSAPVMTS